MTSSELQTGTAVATTEWFQPGSRTTFAEVPTGTNSSIDNLIIRGNDATDVVVLDGALWIMFRESDNAEVAAYHPACLESDWNISFEAYAPKTGSAYIGMDPGRFGLRATIRNGSTEIAGAELAVGNATSEGIYSLEGSDWELVRNGIAPAFPRGNGTQGEKADRYVVSFEWKEGNITVEVRHTLLGVLFVRSFAVPKADAAIHLTSDSEIHQAGVAPYNRSVNGGWMVDDLTIRTPESAYPVLPILWTEAPQNGPVRVKITDELGAPLAAQMSIAGTPAALNGAYYEAYYPRAVGWDVETAIDVDTGSVAFRDSVKITTTSIAQGARIADWWGGWDWVSVLGTDDCKGFNTTKQIYAGYDHPLTAYIQYIKKGESSVDILSSRSELGMHLPHEFIKWKSMNWSEAVLSANSSHSQMEDGYSFASYWDDPSYVGKGDTYISMASPGNAATYQIMFAQYLRGTRIMGVSSNYMDTVPGNSSLYGSWWSPDPIWWTTPGHSWQPSRPEDMMDAMRPWNTDGNTAPWGDVMSIASRGGLLRVYNHQSINSSAAELLRWIVGPKNNFSFENWKATDGEAASYVYARHTTSISSNLSAGSMAYDLNREDPQTAGYWLVPVTVAIDLNGRQVSQVSVVEHTADGDVTKVLKPLAGRRIMERGYDIRNGTLYVSDFFNASATILVTDLTVAITGPTFQPTYPTLSAAINLSGTACGASFAVTRIAWINAATGAYGTAIFTICDSTPWNIFGITLAYGENPITVTAYDWTGNNVSDTLTVVRCSPHNPIYIGNNAQFSQIAAMEGWDGDGSEFNPYIISGYRIDSSPVTGIQIMNTNVHFIISGVYVVSTSHSKMGISLTDVANGSIEYSVITDNLNGIYASSSSNLAIDACTISSCAGNGIHLSSCIDISISGSEIRSNGNNGIYFVSCTDVTMVDTNTKSNGGNGINLQSSNNNALSNNTFSSNFRYGVYLWAGSGNAIWNNKFVGNNGVGKQAMDTGTANRWNSSIRYGNYWSDWTTPDIVAPFGIVDSPYSIIGSAGAKDFYPLVGEISRKNHSPIYINGNANLAAKATVEGWPGDGSEGNPYIISGFNINASSDNGIFIKNTDLHVVISNIHVFSYSHASKGVYLNNVSNARIDDAVSTDNLYGIYVALSKNIEISGFTASSNAGNGIYILSCTGILIEDCDAVSNGNNGIHIAACSGVTMTRTGASSNSWNGVYMKSCAGISIAGGVHDGNLWNGMNAIYCDSTFISGDYSVNGRNGIYVCECPDFVVSGATFSFNAERGAYLISCKSAKITNYVTKSNDQIGLHIAASDDANISNGHSLSNAWNGIYARLCGNLTVYSCMANSNGMHGMYISGCTASNISGGGASYNMRSGIVLAVCNGMMVTGSKAIGNSYYGLHNVVSTNIAISGCTLTGNGAGPTYP